MATNNIEIFEDALKQLNINYSSQMINQFIKYKELVLEWNEKINLTAITNDRDFIIKHFIDSVISSPLFKQKDINTIVDIGTGAGFPGIPLSILYPDKPFLLIDSLNKRIKFLSEVVEILGLKNVSLLHSRAEEIGHNKKYREKFDLCVSRAVAKLNILSEYCLPMVKVGGYLAAYKSIHIEDEINESKNAIIILGGNIEKINKFDDLKNYSLDHQIIYIRKERETPKKYPRKAGYPSKNPLK